MTDHIVHTLLQGSPEWEAFRFQYHGASEAAAMLGKSPYMKRTELLHIKKTAMPKEFSDFVQERILDRGHELEAMARPLLRKTSAKSCIRSPARWARNRLRATA